MILKDDRILVNLSNMDDYPFELEDFDPEVDEISREVVEHEPESTDRSVARRSSLQILYEIDTTQHALGDVLDAHMQERPESVNVRRFIVTIVQGVIENREQLDAIIQQYAPEWPIAQVAIIDRNILRIAVFEYAIQQRAPIPVIINEAVHLAQVFGAENSHSFVHGVLGAITANATIQDKPADTIETQDDEAEIS